MIARALRTLASNGHERYRKSVGTTWIDATWSRLNRCFEVPGGLFNRPGIFFVIQIICGCHLAAAQEPLLQTLPSRQWTSANAKHRVEAQLVDSDKTSATLQKSDGTVVTVRRDQLSAEDRLYINDFLFVDSMPISHLRASKDELDKAKSILAVFLKAPLAAYTITEDSRQVGERSTILKGHVHANGNTYRFLAVFESGHVIHFAIDQVALIVTNDFRQELWVSNKKYIKNNVVTLPTEKRLASLGLPVHIVDHNGAQ